MEVKKNYSLKHLNTFGIACVAKLFTDVNTEADIISIITSDNYHSENKFILGGGSNILFTRDLDALCIHNHIQQITILREDDQTVEVKAGGGITWHDLVLFTVNKNWSGIENLSLIPGS